MKKKGFTLIELLAVLVVLAIIALITIPIVLGIINRARIKSEEASVRGYADALEKSYSQWLIDNPNGTFNDFDYSNVEYKGNRVTCDKVGYSSGNIELNCCYVGNNENNYYSYKNNTVKHYNVCPSKREYHIGDTFILNGDRYYVIADSPTNQDYVVALKDIPLTVSELESATTYVYDYGEEKGHIGGMTFAPYSGYETSDIKSAVDNWASLKFINSELKEVNGYSVRLITNSEYGAIPSTNDWRYNSNYWYWTMTGYSSSRVWRVLSSGGCNVGTVDYADGAIRPVINVYKDKLPD